MSDIQWIKILTGVFEDEKIKILQSMPEGDALIVLWFKLLTQAGKCNMGGFIGLNETTPYDINMLSVLFNKSPQIVEHAFSKFESFGMLEKTDRGFYFITNWEKHQAVDKMEKIREQTRKRVQEYRDKQKGLPAPVTQCNANVTVGNATDKELELELDLEKEKDKKHMYADDVKLTKTEYQKLIDKYGEPLTLKAIELLSNYKGANGKKYKSDYKAMLNWVFDEAQKRMTAKTPLDKNQEKKNVIVDAFWRAVDEENGNDAANDADQLSLPFDISG